MSVTIKPDEGNKIVPGEGLPIIAIRPGDLRDDIYGRRREGQAHGATVKRDIDRYYALLRESLSYLNFNEDEALRLLKLGGGEQPFTVDQMRLLWAEAAKRDEELGRRLRDLDTGQVFAVADAIERAHLEIERGIQPNEALRRVGLVK